MTTDYNVRDVFFLVTGRCGHKWVADADWHACPTCGDYEHQWTGDGQWSCTWSRKSRSP
jgi:hypothetical protein